MSIIIDNEHSDIWRWLSPLLTFTGTLLLGAIAIFRDEIKSWFFKPEISIEISPFEPYTRIAKDVSGYSIYIRLKIINLGKIEARNVRVKATEIYNQKGQLHDNFDPVFLHWVSNEAEKKVVIMSNIRSGEPLPVEYFEQSRTLLPISLNSKEFDYVDFLINIQPLQDNIFFGTTDTPRGAKKYIKWNDGMDFIKIVVQGDNFKPVEAIYKVEMRDKEKFDKINLENVLSEGKIGEMEEYIKITKVDSVITQSK